MSGHMSSPTFWMPIEIAVKHKPGMIKMKRRTKKWKRGSKKISARVLAIVGVAREQIDYARSRVEDGA